jgi:hypothetical protein
LGRSLWRIGSKLVELAPIMHEGVLLGQRKLTACWDQVGKWDWKTFDPNGCSELEV